MEAKSEYQEIIITGFGGQGIIMAGNILGATNPPKVAVISTHVVLHQ